MFSKLQITEFFGGKVLLFDKINLSIRILSQKIYLWKIFEIN